MTALKLLAYALVTFAIIRLLRIFLCWAIGNQKSEIKNQKWVWRIYPWVIDDEYVTNLRNGRFWPRSRRRTPPTVDSAN